MSKNHLLLLTALLIPSLSFAEPIDPAKYPHPVRVACVGDSITQGSGTKGNPYPKQLQELLGDKWEVKNFGVSGRTMLRKGDHPYWNEKAYQNALDFKPDIVIIKLGTNDTKPQNFKHFDDFAKDTRDLANSFLTLESKPKVFLCIPVPVLGKGNFKITEENLQKLIPLIKSVATELGIQTIDLHTAFKDKSDLIPDRVHPNAEGAKIIAETIQSTLTAKPAP